MTKPILCLALIASAAGQQKKVKDGLWPEDWAYTPAPGVTSRDATYYSDGVACYAKVFFPKDFSKTGKTPGVVLGQGRKPRSEEHTSELQSHLNLVCRLLLEKKKKNTQKKIQLYQTSHISLSKEKQSSASQRDSKDYIPQSRNSRNMHKRVIYISEVYS